MSKWRNKRQWLNKFTKKRHKTREQLKLEESMRNYFQAHKNNYVIYIGKRREFDPQPGKDY